jgi:hypothetical protein
VSVTIAPDLQKILDEMENRELASAIPLVLALLEKELHYGLIYGFARSAFLITEYGSTFDPDGLLYRSDLRQAIAFASLAFWRDFCLNKHRNHKGTLCPECHTQVVQNLEMLVRGPIH